jgi:hypothetical protein
MKIAIQGHLTRGKEVIQILESLGGKNTEKLEGIYKTFYYIDNKGEIGDDHRDNFPPICKLYTLDEFEKEFPFKVGDIVLPKGTNNPHEIVALEWFMNKLCYKLDNGIHYAPERLTTYKEMKEERNITLTLDKAKEWYHKGGELKEIALQAFTEKELNPLPKSWEEYCRKYGYVCLSTRYTNLPSKYDALIKLEQLRDCWRQGWKPEYNCGTKYTIKWDKDDLIVATSGRIRAFLIFPTREMAEEFLKCFKNLIKIAGDLI